MWSGVEKKTKSCIIGNTFKLTVCFFNRIVEYNLNEKKEKKEVKSNFIC